jgi:hypothetical protein
MTTIRIHTESLQARHLRDQLAASERNAGYWERMYTQCAADLAASVTVGEVFRDQLHRALAQRDSARRQLAWLRAHPLRSWWRVVFGG